MWGIVGHIVDYYAKFRDIAQWSEGVTKPIKKYPQIDANWDFLITFGCKMNEQ